MLMPDNQPYRLTYSPKTSMDLAMVTEGQPPQSQSSAKHQFTVGFFVFKLNNNNIHQYQYQYQSNINILKNAQFQPQSAMQVDWYLLWFCCSPFVFFARSHLYLCAWWCWWCQSKSIFMVKWQGQQKKVWVNGSKQGKYHLRLWHCAPYGTWREGHRKWAPVGLCKETSNQK